MESRDLATNQIQIQKDNKEVIYCEVWIEFSSVLMYLYVVLSKDAANFKYTGEKNKTPNK